jgi:hypothetical protein
MTMARQTLPQDLSYQPPRGNVLLLSCMDLRLLDDIVKFMNHDNLANRYDHVVFAGAALGALGAPGAKDEHGKPLDFSHWKRAFEDHLGAAVKLHNISDVYILEHRNCGAYYKVFHVSDDFQDSDDDQRKEEECHFNYATLLEKEIATWANKAGVELRTHKFLMDLRGEVVVLQAPRKSTRQRAKSSSSVSRE